LSSLTRIYDAAARDEIDEPARRAYAESIGGDRGRFIQLQLDRVRANERLGASARGSASIERDLLLAHWRQWIGAPALVVPSFAVEFAHGFWDGCTRFQPNVVTRRDVIEEPAWSTVRRLQFNEHVPTPFVRALLAGPVHRSVRAIRVEELAALEVIASWEGTFLAVRELQFFPEKLLDVPSEFPGLPELLRFHVHIIADLVFEPLQAMEKLAAGPGTHSHVTELALTIFGRQQTYSTQIANVIERARRCRAKMLRSIEIGGDAQHHVHLERDEGGEWTKLRVVWHAAYGNHPATARDIATLGRFVDDLPKDFELVVQVPLVETPPLDDLQRTLDARAARLERIPCAPFPPAEISAVGAR
jgi:hypothetical protein